MIELIITVLILSVIGYFVVCHENNGKWCRTPVVITKAIRALKYYWYAWQYERADSYVSEYSTSLAFAPADQKARYREAMVHWIRERSAAYARMAEVRDAS